MVVIQATPVFTPSIEGSLGYADRVFARRSSELPLFIDAFPLICMEGGVLEWLKQSALLEVISVRALEA